MGSRQESVSREYIQLLNKLAECILTGNIRDITNICKTLLIIISSENQEFLLAMQNDSGNPLSKSNLIIFACKNEQYKVLEYLFNNTGERMLVELYEHINIDVIHPSYSDSCNNNAFYYAIRSNNVELVDLLIEKWPGFDLERNIECFEDILSGSYHALTLRNVELSPEMHLYIESRLLDFRSVINGKLHLPGVTLAQIIMRVDWLISKIHRTLDDVSGDKIDIFLQNLKTIAKNIYVLKTSLRSTYDAIPWEEMEFCLSTFVRTRIRDDELNILYWSFITKSALISHLKNFIKCLKAEKVGILDRHSDDTLKIFPTINREQAVKLIIKKYPYFQSLYSDFERSRDIRSLAVMSEYMNVSLAADIEEKNGRLIIVRTLQVLSQFFKNTFEAPKLSEEVRKRLFSNLEGNCVVDPSNLDRFNEVNTRKIIIDIRNSFTSSFVLTQRAEKDDKSTLQFFAKILMGIKHLRIVVKNMIDTGIFLQTKRYSKVLVDCKDLDTVDQIRKLFRSMKSHGLTISGNIQMLQVCINKLRESANSNPHSLYLIDTVNMSLAKIIRSNVSDTDLKKLRHIMLEWVSHMGLVIIGNDEYRLETIQNMAKELVGMFSKFDFVKLSQNLGFGIIDFLNTITSRISKHAYYDVYRHATNAINIIDLLDENFELNEELHIRLTNHNTKFPFDSFEPEPLTKTIETNRAANRTLEIRNIVGVEKYKDKFRNYQLLCEESKGTLLILELLIVETLYSMGYTQECSTNNHANFDARVPLLYGANLLDYLINKPDIVELYTYSSGSCVTNNAIRIASGNFERKACLNEKQLFDEDALNERDCQINNIVCFQHQLLRALSDGQTDVMNLCLENGADIFGRNCDNSTALHNAAKGPSSALLGKILERWKGKIDKQNRDGMNPLHLAAYSGQLENVELLLNRGEIPVDVPDYFGRTALHYSVSTRFINVTKMLIKFRADPNAICEEGQTPLKQALYSKNVEASKLILKLAEYRYEDPLGCSALGVAAEKGLSELLLPLMKLEEKHSTMQKSSSTIMKRPTPLHYAAKNGHIDCLKILLQNGLNLNEKIFNGDTSLFCAVLSNKEEVVRFMLETGADPRDGKSIILAANLGNKKIIEMLISAKAPVNASERVSGCTLLHFVADLNRRDLVELLLKNGVLINAKDHNGQTALHYSARRGYYKLSKLLIKHGAKTNIEDKLNYIPYFYAVLEGHQNIVELMATSSNINHVESLGYTALHCSCQVGHTGIVKYLLGKGAKVNAKANNGRTSLHMVSLNGNREIINLLLKEGAFINDTDSFGNTPLHYAAMLGQAKIVEILIQRGVDISKVNKEGWTPLHMACISGSLESTSLLVKKGCSVYTSMSAKGGVTPLRFSVVSNNISIVELMIKQKVEFDEVALGEAVKSGFGDILELLLDSFPNNSKETGLLLTAVIKRHPEIIKILVKRGADINGICIKTDVGPLHAAAMTGDSEIIQLLLDMGADPNMKSLDGNIPLHHATEFGHLETIVTLLTHKSNILAKDSEGKTPLSIAVAKGHANIVELFLNNNKAININNCFPTNLRCPLLHIAAQSGKIEVVELLVKRGADINSKENNGWKAIHIAAMEGFADIVEFLLSRGIHLYDSVKNGDNLLHLLAYGTGDRLSVAKLLVCNKRMDLNRCNNFGMSPLHSAVSLSNDIGLVKFLLENGAYYNLKTNSGIAINKFATSIPIRLIIDSIQQLFTGGKRGKLSQVRNSIREGAVVNAKNDRNETPLLCATWKGNANVVHELLTNGANPDLAEKSGSTPLHYASKLSNYTIVISLLGSGATFEPINDANKTPLHYSTDSKISKVLKLIQDTFHRIKSLDVNILDTLRDMKLSHDEVRALVNCRDRKGKTIVACAILSNFPDLQRLRSMFCNNHNLESAKKSLCLERSGESLFCAKLERERRKALLFSDDSMMNIDVDMVVALSLCEEQKYEEGLFELQNLYEIYKKMLGENGNLTIAAETMKALALMKKGESKCALKLLKTIIERQKAILSPLHIDLIQTEVHMSKALCLLGKLDEALKLNYDLITRFESVQESGSPITLDIQNDIAKILFEKGKLEESLHLHKQVLKRRKETLGPKHRETLQTMVDIGFVYSSQKKFKQGIQHIVDAIKIQLGIVGQSFGNEEGIVRTKIFNWLAKGRRVNVFKNQINDEFQDDKEIWFPGLVNFFERMERERSGLVNFFERMERGRSGGRDNFLNEGGYDGTGLPNCLDKILEKGENTRIMRIKHVDGMMTLDTSPLNETDESFFSKLLGAETIFSSDESCKPERINKFEAFQAIARGDFTVVAKLIDDGMDFNATDEEGRTALHYAVSSRNVCLVESLMYHGANVNVKSKKGNTPLHIAALSGYANIADVLLNHVKDTEKCTFIDFKTTKSGMTALHIAASKGELEVVKTLLKNGATFDVTNNERKTPLDLSVNEEVTSILRKLVNVFATVIAASCSLKEFSDDELNTILCASRNAEGNSLKTEIGKCKELLENMV